MASLKTTTTKTEANKLASALRTVM